MSRMLVKGVLGAMACIAATAATARAADLVEVKVPFAFMVHGQSFPAGHYTIERDDMASSVVLIRGDKGNRAATFVQTQPAAGHDPAGSMPALQFTRHENDYKLSAIWESGTDGLKLLN